MFGAISSIARSDAASPRVVIVGAGFGGLWAAKTLANAPVVVIDRENYHLFQPLLYQVATTGLSPADIAAPIRDIVGVYRNVIVMLGEIVGVDVVACTVSIMGGRHVPYDYLVLATGARHAYFGHDDWEPFAPGASDRSDRRRGDARRLSIGGSSDESALCPIPFGAS
jgi:NADH dehydrogenase